MPAWLPNETLDFEPRRIHQQSGGLSPLSGFVSLRNRADDHVMPCVGGAAPRAADSPGTGPADESGAHRAVTRLLRVFR
jgi:hypothetical protein